MILWHLGMTLALARYLFRDPTMDVRLLLVGALLPDLVDKPIGRLVWREEFESGRIFGHTLLFSVSLLVIIMVATRRGTAARRTWLPLAIGALFHLVLDFGWTQAATFWWPILGTGFSPSEPGGLGYAFGEGFTSPWVVVGEIVGLVYLAWVWRTAGLSDRAVRSRFLRTGQLGLPIGR